MERRLEGGKEGWRQEGKKERKEEGKKKEWRARRGRDRRKERRKEGGTGRKKGRKEGRKEGRTTANEAWNEPVTSVPQTHVPYLQSQCHSHLRKLPTIYPVETFRPIFVSFPIYDIPPPPPMATPTQLTSDYQVQVPLTLFLCFFLCFIPSLPSRLFIWPRFVLCIQLFSLTISCFLLFPSDFIWKLWPWDCDSHLYIPHHALHHTSNYACAFRFS